MKTYEIQVSVSHHSNGTCGHCGAGTSIYVRFERYRVANSACNKHLMEVAANLVAPYVRSNQRRFKVSLFKERIEVHRDVFASEEFDNGQR